MIQRINLIEKQVLSFTYQKLLQICAIVVLINIGMVGFQFLHVQRINRALLVAQPQLDELNSQYAELTRKKPVQRRVKKVNAGEYQSLFDALQLVPPWSKLLRVLTSNLPNSVWLTTFKSLGSNIVVPPANQAKTGDKDADKEIEDAAALPPPATKIEISGSGTDVKAIAEFTSRLEKTQEFSNVSLVNTEKNEKGYLYTIQGEVVLDNAR